MAALTTRKIVHIDEDKCDGCGACVPSCAEGAIQVIDGKARLVADNLCDGLGNCLGTCPKDAITIEERPAEAFDEAGVEAAQKRNSPRKKPLPQDAPEPDPCPTAGRAAGGCPGRMARMLDGLDDEPAPADRAAPEADADGEPASRLRHWPVQLSLLPVRGPMWNEADVLLAADCAACALPDFHERLLAGRTLAVACPKLDDAEAHAAKLAAVFEANDVRSVTIARMEVACCGGLEHVVRAAMQRVGKALPVTVVTISARGQVAEVNGVAMSATWR